MVKEEAQDDNMDEDQVEENQNYKNMLHPEVENLVNRAGSKFLLVTLSAQRTNDINTYYQGLGSGMAGTAPPQAKGEYSSYLSVAFEEIAEGKTVLSRTPPPEEIKDLPTAATEEVKESAEEG